MARTPVFYGVEGVATPLNTVDCHAVRRSAVRAVGDHGLDSRSDDHEVDAPSTSLAQGDRRRPLDRTAGRVIVALCRVTLLPSSGRILGRFFGRNSRGTSGVGASPHRRGLSTSADRH